MASAAASASASAATAAAPTPAAAAGSKRGREPTDKEIGQSACMDAVFSREASHTIRGAIKGLERSGQNKKARTAASAAKPLRRADGWGEEGEQLSTVAAASSAQSSNPFVALMDTMSSAASSASSRHPSAAPHSSVPSARTLNGAPSFASTKSPVLDFFYHLARGYPREDVRRDMSEAWLSSPELCLRVLAHARDCHGRDGKGERLVSLYGLVWLREHKPQTYLRNLLPFLRRGYFKDLLIIVDMVDQGARWVPPGQSAGPPAAVRGARGGRGGRGGGRGGGRFQARRTPAAAAAAAPASRNTLGSAFGFTSASSVQSPGPLGSSQLELRLFAELLKADSLKLKKWRQQRKAWAAHMDAIKSQAEQLSKQAEEATYAAKLAAGTGSKPLSSYILPSATAWFDDEDALVDDEADDDQWEELSTASVAEARGRVETMDIKEGHMDDAPESAAAAAPEVAASSVAPAKPAAAAVTGPVEPAAHCFISLAAKYAPSEGKHWGGLAKRLARILFGGGAGASGAEHKHGGFQNAAHMASCLKRYRSLLSTLRGHLCITERLACANRWPAINFNAVPSKCHQMLKKAFARHCPERYAAYLASLKRGDKHAKINVTGLAPHELVQYYLDNPRAAANETVEAAWRALVARVEESGTFASAVAVVDVSGSMAGLPMRVAIAMGLLVAAITRGPFRGRVITFHERPSWHVIRGETLQEQVSCLSSAEWGGSTNFGASLSLILDVAVKHRLAQADLPHTLFIWSDMQFDAASGCGGGQSYMQSTHQALSSQYARAGYKLPQLVFWNLNGALNRDCPVQLDADTGCALMSGFSAQLLNVFLRAQGATDPEAAAAEGTKPEDSPLHPLAIMMDSIKDYEVEIEDSER